MSKMSPKPKHRGEYLEHQFVNGLSIHAIDPLLSDPFIRYYITWPNKNVLVVDKMGKCPFHKYHLDELKEIIDRELKHNLNIEK